MSQEAAAAQPLLEKVERMISALMVQNWDEFLPFFSKDLFYKIGAAPPLHSPEECRDFLARVYKKLKPETHDVRGMWQIGNVVIVEMDANYTVIDDGSPVQVPCCDVYRFAENGLIKEWRVYPDASNVKVQF
jgi:ketosteroid isomerase-like protein